MKQVRIGIFGSGSRARQLAEVFLLLGCRIVAVCDTRESETAAMRGLVGEGLTLYSDFEEFIRHDMDAVVLANYFHRHAPYAIRCFERGLHVFSECISNGTMAEGVALVRAHRGSSSLYMLAENYPELLVCREIRRVCQGGTLGKLLYAEGEYNHPADPKNDSFRKMFNYFPEHWRNFLPRTYYITHSLGPVMAATGATPRRVTAFATAAPTAADAPTASRVTDRAAIVTTQNDDGSIFRVTGCAAFGGHHNAYRVCGTRGQIENLRGMENTVMLHYNSWQVPEGRYEINRYTPEWCDPDEEIIKGRPGHGGADYLTARTFLDCVRSGTQPPHPFDLHSAVAMSSVAILAHRSMLEGGTPYDIPDFRREEDCLRWENDFASPFPGEDGTPPTLPCNSDPTYAPTEEQLALYRKSLEE